MLKNIFFLLLSVTFLNANFIDKDMDGVDDRFDKCLNTPFMVLVDKNGCIVKKLKVKNEQNIDISIGYYHSKIDNLSSQDAVTLNFVYTYNQYTFLLSSSRYKIDGVDSGFDDTTLGFFYTFNGKIVSQFGGGVYLPTSDTSDNKTDYFIRAQFIYFINSLDISFGYTKTFMNDKDSVNTDSYLLSVGYSFSDSFYTSISYNSNGYIYDNSKKVDYLSLYFEYDFKNNFYISSTYSKGISSLASENTYSFNIGYRF